MSINPILKRLMLYPLIVAAVVYGFLIFLALRSDGMIFQPHPSSYSDSNLTNQRIVNGRNDYATGSIADSPYKLIKLHSGSDTITALYLSYDPRRDAGGGSHDKLRTSQSPSEQTEPRFTLLMSHGNAEDIGDNRDLYAEYARLGFAVFAYDYPGYGTSTGTPSERNVNASERAAWDYLTQQLHVPPSHIILHGTSVGCGPATELAAQLSSLPVDQRPAALILQSPFRSAFTVLTHVPLLPWDKFNNAKRIRQVHMPVLVIHGTADQVIPFTHGQTVFHNAAPEGDVDAPLTRTSGKQHLWLPNAGHNDIFLLSSQTYFQKIQSFVAQLPQ